MPEQKECAVGIVQRQKKKKISIINRINKKFKNTIDRRWRYPDIINGLCLPSCRHTDAIVNVYPKLHRLSVKNDIRSTLGNGSRQKITQIITYPNETRAQQKKSGSHQSEWTNLKKLASYNASLFGCACFFLLFCFIHSFIRVINI